MIVEDFLFIQHLISGNPEGTTMMNQVIKYSKSSALSNLTQNFSEEQSVEQRPHCLNNCKRESYFSKFLSVFGLPELAGAQRGSNWNQQNQRLPKSM